MILRCTGKVLALLGTPKPSPVEVAAQDWYANLLWIERRKCLLVTHAATLFSVFIPDVRAAQLRPPGPLVVARIHDALRAENLPSAALGRLDAHDVTVAPTASRQILGTMNDHAGLIEHAITAGGGLARCDLDTLHHSLHRTINSVTGYVPPIELVTATR